MTATVFVQAHQKPCRITTVHPDGRAATAPIMVEPGHEQTIHIHDTQSLFVEELQPGAAPAIDFAGEEPILRYFAFAHLPDNPREVSRPFAQLANTLCLVLSRGRSAAWRSESFSNPRMPPSARPSDKGLIHVRLPPDGP